MSTGVKLTESVLKASGGGELPGGQAGSATRAALDLKGFTLAVGVDPATGAGCMTLHHGGQNIDMPFDDEERRVLIQALARPGEINF